MPRAFLVKKPCVSTCKRNWSELPDEERGEIYVPGEAPLRGPEPSAALEPGAPDGLGAGRPVRAAGVRGAATRRPGAGAAGAPDLMFKRPRPR